MDDLGTDKGLTDEQHKALVDCCLGAHEEVWYKFKRFGDLSLLSLYYYQHELVVLDKEIFGPFFGPHANDNFETRPLDDQMKDRLRHTLKEYQEALQLFKQTQQLKRPPFDDRKKTLEILMQRMKENHYLDGHDALGMLDMSPGALGVSTDGIRAKLEIMGQQMMTSSPRTAADHADRYNYINGDDREHSSPPVRQARFSRMRKLPKIEEGSFKPYSLAGRLYQVPENPVWDRVIQFVVAMVAAATLLAPLITLSYIRERAYTIMAACLFIIVFAFLVSMISNGSTTEVMVAVATYSAVLVVFVGQTIAPPS